ncbi:hypothetical protein CDL15_Pgr023584 [Punica granatum]|uniref:Uncharacterized protein n=1 Tax=Punica granatum TaxID=22663 RepID=A0A218W804_PUNGR|nr:hypothetical protein CDL15_Pgr023584 [Punica granatum]
MKKNRIDCKEPEVRVGGFRGGSRFDVLAELQDPILQRYGTFDEEPKIIGKKDVHNTSWQMAELGRIGPLGSGSVVGPNWADVGQTRPRLVGRWTGCCWAELDDWAGPLPDWAELLDARTGLLGGMPVQLGNHKAPIKKETEKQRDENGRSERQRRGDFRLRGGSRRSAGVGIEVRSPGRIRIEDV